MATHEVLNQATPLVGHDVAGVDVALLDGVERDGGAWGLDELRALGRRAGEAEVIRWGELANEHGPVLHRFDRFGHRVDEIEFHPSYHHLMREAIGAGLHAAPWADERAGAHVVRAAKFSVWTQVEAGHGCPVSMTYSIIPALREAPNLAATWEPLLVSTEYDPDPGPAAAKRGVTAGMAMTEKQGGSDVRANTTRAVPDGEGYRLTGHKWFCSAPQSDLFLVLAHAERGITCFAMPRWLPDGTRNAISVERLKDKLGNRSNASSEIELTGAWAARVGDEGAGIRTIIRMVNHTRLDCVIGVTGQLRAGFSQAAHHATTRAAFGRTLIDQPLMRQVLADLALESEAATTTMLRLAAGYDRAEEEFCRLATAVAKFWVCKRAPMFAAEALECWGGNGYVETGPMARLFRESPLNGIWEGSGNVIALDVLRAITREPASLTAFLDEVALAHGADRRLDRFVDDLHAEVAGLADLGDAQPVARRITERLALALQASLLVRHAPTAVADGFCASRLTPDRGAMLGALPAEVDVTSILERAWPAIAG